MKTRLELLATRAQHLRLRDKNMEEIVLRKQRKRMEAKEAFDLSRQLQKKEITTKDVVLRHNAKLELDKSTTNKLVYKWIGPYYVHRAILEKGTYKLEEFDGTPILGTHLENCLKKFVRHNRFYELVD